MLLNQAGDRVKVKAVDTDKYGRTVADLYTDDGLVQLQQVRDGWVWANFKYKSDCAEWNAIAAAEKEAKAARRGIWTLGKKGTENNAARIIIAHIPQVEKRKGKS